MKKKTKEIIETTTLAVGVILLSAAAFYSSKETGKTELKTDRKEQITSEQETKEAYEAAQKELSFWYSDADCRNYFEQCAVDYYAKTGIAVGIRYVDEESYLEQIYDATMTEEDYPDLYLAWNDAKDKAYLYGVATEEEYPLFFDTLVMVYQKENFPEAPESISEILDYGQNNLLGEGVGNLLEWNVADGFYDYPFVGTEVEWNETDYTLLTTYGEKYNDELTFFKNLSETVGIDTDEIDRNQVVENFNQGASLCAIIDSDDLNKMTAENYGVCGLPMLDDTTPMQGRTLGFLYCNKDKVICQKDIEQEFLISRATASKMLQSMEKKELITRKELKEDARLKQILLTKKGEQQHLKMMNFFSGVEKLLVDGMTKEEADELSSLLKRVRHNLEKNL